MNQSSIQPSISFRPLGRSDFSLLQRWLSTPHVDAWWHDPLDPAGVEARYGRRVDGADPTHVFVIEYAAEPIGWIQWYRWFDYPAHALQLGANLDSAGIDLAIGEPDRIAMGLGPIAISEFLRRIVFADPRVSGVVADPQEANVRSLRAFEKAAFTQEDTVQLAGENFKRVVVRVNRPQGQPLVL